MAAPIRKHGMMFLAGFSPVKTLLTRVSTQYAACALSTTINRELPGKEERRLNKYSKLLNRKLAQTSGGRKKKVWHENPQDNLSFSKSTKPSISAGSERRAKHLSVVLYEYVTSLINSGEIEPRLSEMGFYVDRVRCMPDFTQINIYWLATGSDMDGDIEALLPDTAHKLRQALVSLKIMGHLPMIFFVKDLSQARMQEVERLLAMADMGPDHEPTPLGADMKSILKVPADRMPDLQAHLSKVAERFVQADTMKENPSNFTITSNKDNDIKDNLGDTDDLDSDLVAKAKVLDNVLRSDLYGIDHKALTKKLGVSRTRPSGSVQEPVVMPTPGLGELRKSMPLISSKRPKKLESKDRVVNREAYEYRLSELLDSQEEFQQDDMDDDHRALEDLDSRIDQYTQDYDNDEK